MNFKKKKKNFGFLTHRRTRALYLGFNSFVLQFLIQLRLSQNLSTGGLGLSAAWVKSNLLQQPKAVSHSDWTKGFYFSLWLDERVLFIYLFIFLDEGILKQQFPKCGLWTSGSNAHQELFRSEHSLALALACWMIKSGWSSIILLINWQAAPWLVSLTSISWDSCLHVMPFPWLWAGLGD